MSAVPAQIGQALRVRIVVLAGIGGRERAEALRAALVALNADADVLDLSSPPGETALKRMAGALRAAEAELAERAPHAVALTGDDDHSLAAALVVTKLHIPMYRLDAAPNDARQQDSARIDSLLADAVVSGTPAEAAIAIAAAVAANGPPDAPE